MFIRTRGQLNTWTEGLAEDERWVSLVRREIAGLMRVVDGTAARVVPPAAREAVSPAARGLTRSEECCLTSSEEGSLTSSEEGCLSSWAFNLNKSPVYL